MASIHVPANVSSMTFATSGVKTPDSAGVISGLTAAEATAYNDRGGSGAVAVLVSSASNGDVTLALPGAGIATSITINSVVYSINGADHPSGGKLLSAAVPAAAATIVLNQGFYIVTG